MRRLLNCHLTHRQRIHPTERCIDFRWSAERASSSSWNSDNYGNLHFNSRRLLAYLFCARGSCNNTGELAVTLWHSANDGMRGLSETHPSRPERQLVTKALSDESSPPLHSALHHTSTHTERRRQRSKVESASRRRAAICLHPRLEDFLFP